MKQKPVAASIGKKHPSQGNFRRSLRALIAAIDKIRGGVSGTRLKIVRCADGN